MTFVALETERHVARHVVTVSEALGDRAVGSMRAEVMPAADAPAWCVARASSAPPPGWWFDTAGNEVRIASSARSAAGSPLAVGVVMTDPTRRHLLLTDCLTVALTDRVHAISFPPAPMTVHVEVVRPDGTPSGGQVVSLRAAAVTIPVPETPNPGAYQTAPRTFSQATRTFDVVVGGAVVATKSLDLDQLTTRIRIIDPT